MQVKIFNVGHGACALVIADNQNLLLLDCGHDDALFRPSRYLPQNWKAVQQLVVSHYDSDHVSDLAELVAKMPIERVMSNVSIGTTEIRRLKQLEGVVTPGMEALLRMKNTFGPAGGVSDPDLSGIHWKVFAHSYSQFQDMNNLSLVTFVEYDGLSIVFPGDLERAGWLAHLQNPIFRQYVSRVQVFVASHHGRDNGYCEEAFENCNPQIVVISDTSIQHESQRHSYTKHASGVNTFRNGISVGTRFVFTTRSDGHITFSKTRGQPWTFQTGK